MKQKSLFLMCGTPGSGKSTWVQKEIKACQYPVAWVSRDKIRFEIVREDEEYFSHEDEVFDKFVETIQAELDAGKVVFADATHLNPKSRNKTLDRLNLEDVELYAVNFDLPVEVCLAQNENRRGDGRTYVPRSVVRRMHASYVAPGENEKYQYHVLDVVMK